MGTEHVYRVVTRPVGVRQALDIVRGILQRGRSSGVPAVIACVDPSTTALAKVETILGPITDELERDSTGSCLWVGPKAPLDDSSIETVASLVRALRIEWMVTDMTELDDLWLAVQLFKGPQGFEIRVSSKHLWDQKETINQTGPRLGLQLEYVGDEDSIDWPPKDT